MVSTLVLCIVTSDPLLGCCELCIPQCYYLCNITLHLHRNKSVTETKIVIRDPIGIEKNFCLNLNCMGNIHRFKTISVNNLIPCKII